MPKHEKYVFRKYNPEYGAFFISEKKKLAKVLGMFAKIEHVGSTAVHGLGGKGIVDIVVCVLKQKIIKAKNQLEDAGYEFREKAGSRERLFFRQNGRYKNRKRQIHVHLTKLGSRTWKEMTGFRNYLLKHHTVVEQYIRIKKEAMKKACGSGLLYGKHKKKFIKQILKKCKKT